MSERRTPRPYFTLPNVPGGALNVYECERCGALVIMAREALHDEFHDVLSHPDREGSAPG